MSRLKDFTTILDEELRDPEFAREYLATLLEENDLEAFLIGLGDVVRVQGGMSQIAQRAEIGRESLYKSLSGQRNPQIKTVNSVLGALGMQLTIRCQTPDISRAA